MDVHFVLKILIHPVWMCELKETVEKILLCLTVEVTTSRKKWKHN